MSEAMEAGQNRLPYSGKIGRSGGSESWMSYYDV